MFAVEACLPRPDLDPGTYKDSCEPDLPKRLTASTKTSQCCWVHYAGMKRVSTAWSHRRKVVSSSKSSSFGASVLPQRLRTFPCKQQNTHRESLRDVASFSCCRTCALSCDVLGCAARARLQHLLTVGLWRTRSSLLATPSARLLEKEALEPGKVY